MNGRFSDASSSTLKAGVGPGGADKTLPFLAWRAQPALNGAVSVRAAESPTKDATASFHEKQADPKET